MWSFKVKAALGIAGITLLAATAWSVYNAGFRAGESKIQAKWDAEVAQMAQAQAAEVNAARIREQELQAQITAQQRTHRNEIARINARHASILDGLRDRPERPDSGGVPEGAGVGAELATGCTGAQLYRPDGEFLAREAARADQLRIALNACIRAYNEVMENINARD